MTPTRLAPATRSLLLLGLLFSVSACLRAQRSQQPPACAAADLDFSFRFANDPPATFTIALLARNTSASACTLAGPGAVAFTHPRTPTEPAPTLCLDCDRRTPGAPGAPIPDLPPITLAPGNTAHETLRWTIQPTSAATSCQHPETLAFTIDADSDHLVTLAGTSLLHPICSQVDVERFAPGTYLDADLEASASPPPLVLTADKPSYALGEFFAVHAELGRATGLLTSASTTMCPPLFLLQRTPDGTTRMDQFSPLILKCAQRNDSSSAHVFTDFDSFAHFHPTQPGDLTLQFLAPETSVDAHIVNLAASALLNIHIVDPVTLPHPWGLTEKGLRVALFLDKQDFQFGEDIPLHIAAEVLAGPPTIYGEPFLQRAPAFSTFPAAFHLEISGPDGPLPGSEKPANLFRIARPANPSAGIHEPGGLAVCPTPLTPGKIIPFERSLRLYDLLRTQPGAYTLTVSWTPYTAAAPNCPLPTGAPGPTAPVPYATVYSAPIQIRVLAGENSAIPNRVMLRSPMTARVLARPPTPLNVPYTVEEADSMPEYTAWQTDFSLVDTPLGKRSALLDQTTRLEWLRLRFTDNRNEEWAAKQMRPGRALAGFRFATQEEVVDFIARFTGSPTGVSHDVAVERELQGLLGGPLSTPSNAQTGFRRRSTYGRIAGLTSPENPASPNVLRFTYRYAYIAEDERDGEIKVTINPNQMGGMDGDRSTPGTGIFLVRERSN